MLKHIESLPQVSYGYQDAKLRLWGVTRETIVAALVFRKRYKSRIEFVLPRANKDSGLESDLEALGFATILEQEAGGARVLYGPAAHPPEMHRAEKFVLEHGSGDRLSVELHNHSALELHEVAKTLESLGLKSEANFLHHAIYYITNCRIPNSVEIGEGTTLAYGGLGVVLNKNSKIGRNVKIGQNVTLGAKPGGYGPPVIGDGAFIGPNSVCLGGVIGEGAVIGAGSVVLKPVSANAVVAGNPARPIRSKSNGSY